VEAAPVASAQPETRPEGRDPDILTAAELAERLGIKFVQTVRDAIAAGDIPGGRPGREFLASWQTVYEWIAGPGVPDGPVVDAKGLSRRLRISERIILRSAAPPGTPSRIPGRQIGKRWRFAVEAARLAIDGLQPVPPPGADAKRPGDGAAAAGSASPEGGPAPG